QLEADLFAVDRYRNQLDLARQKLRVLENQTKPKEIIGFDSEILAAQAELSSAEKARDLEVAALEDILDQLDKCTIRVPEGLSGQVVYANIFSSRGGSEWVLEEGATVRERQVLVRLPNLQKMQVYAKVNEAQIAAVRENMPVEVQVDAMRQAGSFGGHVTKVNPYAEPESWTSGGVRRYGVYVELQDPPSSIRPGMNASVSIETRYEPAALQIPVQALAEQQGVYYVAVKSGESFETRVVEV
ncbi:MAG: efflux RND transporter periplasmic adaptor subunit, partial [Planctomycetales bacterium]|nr:efflux RND transporter periplasmic adaptor subunit [Planctomycetales bacterium]